MSDPFPPSAPYGSPSSETSHMPYRHRLTHLLLIPDPGGSPASELPGIPDSDNRRHPAPSPAPLLFPVIDLWNIVTDPIVPCPCNPYPLISRFLSPGLFCHVSDCIYGISILLLYFVVSFFVSVELSAPELLRQERTDLVKSVQSQIQTDSF